MARPQSVIRSNDPGVLRAAEHWTPPVGRWIFYQPGVLYAADEVLEREVDLQARQRPAYTAVIPPPQPMCWLFLRSGCPARPTSEPIFQDRRYRVAVYSALLANVRGDTYSTPASLDCDSMVRGAEVCSRVGLTNSEKSEALPEADLVVPVPADLGDRLTTALSATPSTVILDTFAAHREATSWVNNGRRLHGETGTCIFCRSGLADELL
jgi:hypothetical protein